MRLARLLLWGLTSASFLSQVRAQDVSSAQLRSFLLEQHRFRSSDTETANRLASVSPAERLSDQVLNRIINETKPGPESVEQLRLLADLSIFAPPPANESPVSPSPEPEVRRAILQRGAEYAHSALRHLPDFLAVRDTRRFDNRPQATGISHPKAKIQLHWIGQFKDQITYRNGAEVVGDPDTKQAKSAQTLMHPGLLSFGEFGPILSVIFNDFAQGEVEWARSELDPVDGWLAVFRFNVPKLGSHYLVDYCCYTKPEEEMEFSFRDHPAYHGEVLLSPDSGVVRRIVIQADLDSSSPVLRSDLAVQYGEVEIGGRTYVCPVRSIAITAIHNVKMKPIDGIGIQRQLNEVQYLDYHKFGSTSRVLTTP